MATYENNIRYAPFNSVNRDRAINADDLAEWLSSVNSDGVARKYNEFEATVSGMNVTIDTGIGFVDGHYMYMWASQIVPIATASVSGTRIDTIGFRLEKANRKVVLYYTTGTVGENAPTPLDNDTYKEVPLYNITVGQSVQTLTSANLTDVREYVVSSATYFKKYDQNFTISSTTSQVTITVPFNSVTDTVSVHVNTNELLSTQYTISGNVITFASPIYSGNQIQIDVWHFQDGSGSMDSFNNVLTELQGLEEVKKYYYFCTGSHDNLALSDIAQNFLNGTGEFSGINAYAQMEIIICGDMGNVAMWYSGNGTQAYPKTYFAFGRASTSTRTIYFNFSNCSRINVIASGNTGEYSTIFSGADINIRNVALAVATGYNVDIFNGQNVHCADSEFWMTTENNCCVGRCCGFFENVRTSITSSTGNAFGFYGNGRLLRVIGGTHYAWTGNADGGKEGVCFYVEAYQTANVLFIQMANMPQYTRSGYTQTDTVKVNHGYATIMSNTMWKAATVYSTDNCIRYGNVITTII